MIFSIFPVDEHLLERTTGLYFHFTIKPNIYGTLAAHLLSIHCTAMVAGLGFTFSHTGLASKMAHRLFRLGLSFSDKIMVLNEENRRILMEQGMARKSNSCCWKEEKG